MTDIILKDGREITFDLSQMTFGQYLGLFDPKEAEERSDKTLARVAGLEFKELKALPFPEYKRLIVALFRKAREPLSDPNLPSASTSD